MATTTVKNSKRININLRAKDIIGAIASGTMFVVENIALFIAMIFRIIKVLIVAVLGLAAAVFVAVIVVGSIVLAIGYINAPAAGTITAKDYHEGTGTSCFTDSNGAMNCATDEDTWTFVLTDKNGNSGPVDVSKSVYQSHKVGQQYAR